MKRILWKKLWRDEQGGVEFIALMLITAVVAMAGIVGLVQIRDQVTQELGDTAVALDTLDQSFSYTIQVDTQGNGTFAYQQSASYADPGSTLTDPLNAAPACLNLSVAPTFEGDTPVAPSGQFP